MTQRTTEHRLEVATELHRFIERQVLQHYALPDGRVYTCEETTGLANQMLKTPR